MKKNETQQPPAFGDVDMNAEHGIFVIDTGRGRSCRLTLIGHTERGFPRRELASIPGKVWKEIAAAVQNELVRGMEGRGETKNRPRLVAGENALSPLLVRELSVLLWALMGDEEGTHTDALLAGWKQLACEERWWLYARASSPTQKHGQGWRHALFFALNDSSDTRTMVRPAAAPGKRVAKKKSSAKPRTQSSGSSGTTNSKRATTPKNSQPAASKKMKPESRPAAKMTKEMSEANASASPAKAAKRSAKKTA
jgi:hypothetical protein